MSSSAPEDVRSRFNMENVERDEVTEVLEQLIPPEDVARRAGAQSDDVGVGIKAGAEENVGETGAGGDFGEGQEFGASEAGGASEGEEGVHSDVEMFEELTEAQQQALLEDDLQVVFSKESQTHQKEGVQEAEIKKLQEELRILKKTLLSQRKEQFEKFQEMRAELVKSEARRTAAQEELQTAKKKLKMLEDTAKIQEEDFRRLCQTQANSFSRADQGRRCDPMDWRKGIVQPSDATVYCCKCPTACVFRVETRKDITTTSPTILIRMLEVAKRFPKVTDEDVRILGQKPIPWACSEVSDEAWGILAKCPSMGLWLDRQAIRLDFEATYNQRLKECRETVPEEAPEEMVTLIMSGVKRALVPISPKPTMLLNETFEQQLQKCCVQGCKQLLLVIPLGKVDEYGTRWQSVIDAVPVEVNVIVVPAPIRDYVPENAAKYQAAMAGLSREHGQMWRVMPLDVILQQGKMIVDIGATESARKYWESVEEWARQKEVRLPALEILEEPKRTVAVDLKPIVVENWAEQVEQEAHEQSVRSSRKRDGENPGTSGGGSKKNRGPGNGSQGPRGPIKSRPGHQQFHGGHVVRARGQPRP